MLEFHYSPGVGAAATAALTAAAALARPAAPGARPEKTQQPLATAALPADQLQW